MPSWCSRRCRRRRRRASRCRASLKVSRAAQVPHGALLPRATRLGLAVQTQKSLVHVLVVEWWHAVHNCHAAVGTAREACASEVNSHLTLNPNPVVAARMDNVFVAMHSMASW